MKKKHAKLKPGYCWELDHHVPTKEWKTCSEIHYRTVVAGEEGYGEPVYIGTRRILDTLSAVFICGDGVIRAQVLVHVLSNAG
jgi:hypothetical protein